MKGILLAGGLGTRLEPLTIGISKQLLPIYNKPMVYYPLSALMLAGIKEVLIISTPRDLPLYQNVLKDGKQWGISLTYQAQHSPAGIAQAFLLGEEFLANDSCCLALGDNVFYGHGFTNALRRAATQNSGATVFGYLVKDPQRYGVVEFNEKWQAISIEEKPKKPKSNFAITGIYFYDNKVVQIAKDLKPSNRGELEISDVNKEYLKIGALKVERLGRGVAWLDTGTHESLMQAGVFIQTIEERQGLMVACLEEIAYRQGLISRQELSKIADGFASSSYGDYLRKILGEEKFYQELV